MKKITFYCLLVFILFSCRRAFIDATVNSNIPIPWTDSSNRHPKNAAFRQLIENYRQKGLPGISLLVRDKNGTWIGSTGKADIEKNIPFQVGQVSKVASITKLFIGVLAFKLFEDSLHSHLGYQSLFQPINKWLPHRITDKITNGNIITLGQCLNHETGVADLISEDKFYLSVLNKPNRAWKAEDLLAIIYDKPAVFYPGDTAIYSNTNTLLVAMVIESATGRKHNELLHEYLFTPLALKNSYYLPYDEIPNTAAQGYFDLYNNQKIVNVSNYIPGSGWGYNGVYSNAFDLYRFMDALLISKTLLSPKSLQLMQTYGKADFPNEYGYGIMKKFINRGANAGIGHSGRDLGYTANLFYFPQKQVGHVFLINYGTDSDSKLKQVFVDFQNELLDLTLQ